MPGVSGCCWQKRRRWWRSAARNLWRQERQHADCLRKRPATISPPLPARGWWPRHARAYQTCWKGRCPSMCAAGPKHWPPTTTAYAPQPVRSPVSPWSRCYPPMSSASSSSFPESFDPMAGSVIDLSAWPSLTLEGNLLAPAMVARVDRREAPEQGPETYGVRRGLTLREEISTAFRVGQSHFDAFARLEAPSAEATRRFLRGFLEETFGFQDLEPADAPLAFVAGGRVPIVAVPPGESLDRRSPTLSAERSRSPTFALQDCLNDREEALWGLVANGTHLRLMRDNASLTRPAYIEADLAQIFANEDAASFAALWLLIHRSRFGPAGSPATDCALERWREAGAREGEAARDRLAGQVQLALKVLGSGFLEANPELAARLRSGQLDLTAWFNELLRLVYRLIFLMVAEDRDLLHPTDAKPEARQLYATGYSLATLRALSLRGAAWDRHGDRYEGLKVVFRALARGEARS